MNLDLDGMITEYQTQLMIVSKRAAQAVGENVFLKAQNIAQATRIAELEREVRVAAIKPARKR